MSTGRENVVMDDLVQWFGEQLDEDERIARTAGGVVYVAWAEGGWVEAEVPKADWKGPGDDGRHVGSVRRAEDRAHIAAHDPARALRDIASDRKLLALFVEVGAREVDLDDAFEYAHGWVNALGMAVRLRASAFSDRPGYREEWRPY